ncbi:hypothetical protein BDZ89DRAFT_1222401 [Hymenopellis radicata]|nr:hypothetical protein BDZ89DRAFT_1222401 [Hymenopellis radicata]
MLYSDCGKPTGMYTNDWDPNNSQIRISEDYGASFTVSELPFKVGGNLLGRGLNNILFFGARSGNGLYTSSDYGSTWSRVSGLSSIGNYAPDPTDSTDYNNDLIGISWVTFDASSGTAGSATRRIFVGVANFCWRRKQRAFLSSVLVLNSLPFARGAINGQQTIYFPHKGVISPAEGVLTSRIVTEQVPLEVSGSTTIAGSNCADALRVSYHSGTYRTLSGSTWPPFWDWASYPTMNKYYSYSDDLTPWLGLNYVDQTLGNKQIRWMMEVIDPFGDSDHLLYGTGATIYCSRDLNKRRHLKADFQPTISPVEYSTQYLSQLLRRRHEETAVQALISPQSGPSLLSGVYDIEGFVHEDLDALPGSYFTNPTSILLAANHQ